MLTYSFTNIGSESLYIHLYNCIKNDILSGVLPSGFNLPSKRSFAKNLGISTITVENSYERLIDEGYVYSIPKKGYYVSEIKTVAPETVRPPMPEEGKKETEYAADLVNNNMLSELFPFSTWARLMREVISRRSRELMQIPPCGGIYELREAIAKHLYQFRGITAEPKQIVIGAGTEYLYGLLIQLLGNDKVFAVENPGYSKLTKIYKSHNVVCEQIPIDASGASADFLRKSDVNVLHISPSHHFPTGIVMPISRRYELLGWATGEKGRYIIEDDYDSELRLSGRPIPSLKSIDAADSVIYMNTFTKSLAPTIRISYMVMPQTLTREFYKRLGFYSCTVSNFEQYTLCEFINGGHFENHINRMRKYYKKIRDELLERIECDPILKNAEIREENSGLHFLMRLKTDKPDRELSAAVKRHGVNIACLSEYYSGGECPDSGTLIINYSNIAPDKLSDVVSRISEAVKNI